MTCIGNVISILPSENQGLMKAIASTCRQPMEVLKTGTDLSLDRAEVLKAVSMFIAIARSMGDLPQFTQMESLLPLFNEVWPVLKPVMLAR